MKNKRIITIMLIVGILLFIPFIAMQFTSEVSWDGPDFIIAGILLTGAGLLCELVLRRVRKTQLRIILCGSILLALILIWAELAVGIFGSPISGS